MTHRTQRPELYPKRAMTEVDSHEQFPNKMEVMSEQVAVDVEVEMKGMSSEKGEIHSVKS